MNIFGGRAWRCIHVAKKTVTAICSIEFVYISNISFYNRLGDAEEEKSKDIPWPFKIEADIEEAQTQQQQQQQQRQRLHTQYFAATTEIDREVFIGDFCRTGKSPV